MPSHMKALATTPIWACLGFFLIVVMPSHMKALSTLKRGMIISRWWLVCHTFSYEGVINRFKTNAFVFVDPFAGLRQTLDIQFQT